MEEIDLDSTLIRRGRNAVTFTDMAEFARTLEQRSLVTLLNELPDLARLSESKFILATKILRRRFDTESPVDQLQLRAFAEEIAASIADADLADRVRGLFATY